MFYFKDFFLVLFLDIILGIFLWNIIEFIFNDSYKGGVVVAVQAQILVFQCTPIIYLSHCW